MMNNIFRPVSRNVLSVSRRAAVANSGRLQSRTFSPSSAPSGLSHYSTSCVRRSSQNDNSTSSSTQHQHQHQPNPPLLNKISVIGAGMMATAMVEPMIKGGVQPPAQFAVYDVSDDALRGMREAYGVVPTQSIADCLRDTNLVILAVKPQNLTPAFLQQLRDAAQNNENCILLSVIAGTPISVLQQSGVDKVVRSMPNTPATIGQGMTVWSCTPNLTTDERALVKKVLNSFGKTMYVDDEAFIDMSTSISGSGPAYIFMLMEAMIDAGVHMGFPRHQATTLVYHTMLGSTLYAMETEEHPAILRNRVTSPSGTTASAIYELENGKFRTVIKDAMWACYRRSLEMGSKDPNVGPSRNKFHDEK